jgi:hypothetical protein
LTPPPSLDTSPPVPPGPQATQRHAAQPVQAFSHSHRLPCLPSNNEAVVPVLAAPSYRTHPQFWPTPGPPRSPSRLPAGNHTTMLTNSPSPSPRRQPRGSARLAVRALLHRLLLRRPLRPAPATSGPAAAPFRFRLPTPPQPRAPTRDRACCGAGADPRPPHSRQGLPDLDGSPGGGGEAGAATTDPSRARRGGREEQPTARAEHGGRIRSRG